MSEVFEHIAAPGLRLAYPKEQAASDDLFTALLSRHSRLAYQVAYSVLRNRQDSEDVVQDTFLRIYRSRAWQRMEDEKGFIASVAWRLAVSRAKRSNRADPDPTTAPAHRTPEQSAIAADLQDVLTRLIDGLPDELRQPLALSAVQGLNSHQIAGIMAIPEGTVRSRLARARQVLKQKAAAVLGTPK